MPVESLPLIKKEPLEGIIGAVLELKRGGASDLTIVQSLKESHISKKVQRTVKALLPEIVPTESIQEKGSYDSLTVYQQQPSYPLG